MYRSFSSGSSSKRFSGIAFVLTLIAILSGCRLDDGVTVLKLGHGLDAQHPVHVAMEYMGERLVELSDGAMRIDIYPSQQLGTERETLELLQIGSLGMTKVSSAVLEAFAPEFQVFGLPYLLKDDEHRFGVLDSDIGAGMLESMRPFNLVGLGFYDAGFRSFYASRPVRTPEDLRGLKVRVQESPIAVRMVRALGGAPTPISWGELYTALQQGIVDGAENNPPSFFLSRHYEVSRFYSLNEHTAVPDVLIVSSIIWDDLSDQQRMWLRQAATESIAYQRRLWEEAETEALEGVASHGVEVIRPDKEPFRAEVEPLIETYLDHPQIGPLIERIRGFDAPAADSADAVIVSHIQPD